LGVETNFDCIRFRMRTASYGVLATPVAARA
jgi:hypothetical protein